MTNDTVHSYTYDAEGNILKVDAGSTAVYVYDALNRRVHVQTASATNEFAYDYAGRRVSTWLSPNNSGTEGRIYWDGQQIGYRSSDGTTYFEHQDTLGTERMRTNYGASAGSTYLSLPWGDGYTATVNNSGADQDNLHFAGLEHDAESDTEHAQFRNYASAQGRWLAPDPYMGSYDLTNPQSMNRYSYALNNPTSMLDPSGLYTLPTGPCDPTYSNCDPGGPSNPIGCVSWGTQGCIPYPNPGNPGNPGGGSGGGNPGPPFVFKVNATTTQITDLALQVNRLEFVPFGVTGGVSVAPNNPQQPQKPKCDPLTRLGGAIKALSAAGDAAGSFNLAWVHVAAAGFLIGAGCLEPTPFEPATCVASGFGGVALLGGATVLTNLGTHQVEDEVIPGIKQAVTCTPEGE